MPSSNPSPQPKRRYTSTQATHEVAALESMLPRADEASAPVVPPTSSSPGAADTPERAASRHGSGPVPPIHT